MKNIYRAIVPMTLVAGFLAFPQAQAQSYRYDYPSYTSQQYAIVRSVDPVYSNTTLHTVCSNNQNRYVPGQYDRYGYENYPPEYRGYTNRYGQYIPYPYGERNDSYDQYGRYDRYDGYYPRSVSDAARAAAVGAVISTVVGGGRNVGTAVGTVINEAVRSQVYNRTYGYPRDYPTQRYCWTERRPAGMIRGYDVQHQYNGRLMSTRLNWAPRVGQTVRVDRYGTPLW